jgi:N-acetylglucosaminyldiphosphoundecaprenol N-acetyl-beta-D-mannosaminyltransferase
LIGFGSPIQEQWLIENRSNLNTRTALAVGGLFDFYSGSIPRSPLWMRELGLEWIWRLMQDPVGKWQRYVIGNPLYLYRLWLSNRN